MDLLSTHQERIKAHVDAVRRYAALNGHLDIPVEWVDPASGLNTGKWASNVRHQYRHGHAVPGDLVAELESVPGWRWELRRRGRPPKGDRNAQIVELYAGGVSSTVIAEQFGVTPQRVRQIVKRGRAL